jgi:hypothetical protein
VQNRPGLPVTTAVIDFGNHLRMPSN